MELAILNEILNPGECSSIVLAKNKIGLLSINDKKGRMYAEKYVADIIGTGAVLLFAKKKGLI
jgi:predicted nucleic acid-binding protein